jgi:hypothetical protein
MMSVESLADLVRMADRLGLPTSKVVRCAAKTKYCWALERYCISPLGLLQLTKVQWLQHRT